MAPLHVVSQQRPGGGAHESLYGGAEATGARWGGEPPRPSKPRRRKPPRVEYGTGKVSVDKTCAAGRAKFRGTKGGTKENMCRAWKPRAGDGQKKKIHQSIEQSRAAYLQADFALDAHSCPVCKELATRPRRPLAP